MMLICIYQISLSSIQSNGSINAWFGVLRKKNMESSTRLWGVIRCGAKDMSIVENDNPEESGRDKGKSAVTHWRVLRRFEFSTLLACRLETGRTHQIRVHLTSIGHPVIGDPKYGKSPLKQLSGIPTELSQTLTNFKRQALHAEILGFEHPVSGEWLEFKAPFPDDYKILLKAIQHD